MEGIALVIENTDSDASTKDSAKSNRSKSSRPVNVCTYWNCEQSIRAGYYLCSVHYPKSRSGTIDVCPGCGRYKEVRYKQCIECRKSAQSESSRGRSKAKGNGTRTARKYEPEYSPDWEARDATATAFYVYVLKLNGGNFYAGQTRELRERLSEHRDGRVKSTAGRDPKMVWFTEVSTRDEATELESELKKTVDRNPRVIRSMIIEFQDLVKELEFE